MTAAVLHSDFRRLCRVDLPYRGRQRYMHSFDLGSIAAPEMPEGFEDYHKPVKKLLHAAAAFVGFAHMTVDEKVVKAGESQRRPKPHVDGCFMPSGRYWGHGGGGGWLHECNNVPGAHVARMPVIVAASIPGCRAWRGRFKGSPRSDGDLTHIQDQLGEGEVLEAGVGYLLSPDCVHESMLMSADVQRTFLRIALPVAYKDYYMP